MGGRFHRRAISDPHNFMEIRIFKEPTTLSVIAAMAKDQFGEMIKAAVDIERGVDKLIQSQVE